MTVQIVIGAGVRSAVTGLSWQDAIPELDKGQIDAGFRMVDQGHHLLFSDPGAGKTLTALHGLAYLEEQFRQGAEPARVLVLCPAIAVRTWLRWIYNVYDQALEQDAVVQYVEGNKRDIREDATHVVMTHGTLARGGEALKEKITAFWPDVIIVDESDNFNGVDSARTETLFGKSPDFRDGLVANAEWVWYMTGTPLPRYHDGLYPVLKASFEERVLDIFDKEFHEVHDELTYQSFVHHFCYTEKVKFGAMKRTQERVSGSKNAHVMNKLLYGGDEPIATRNKLNMTRPVIKEVTIYPKFSKALDVLVDELSEPKYREDARVIESKLATAMRMHGEECAEAVAMHVSEELVALRKADAVTGVLLLFWHRAVGDKLQQLMNDLGWRVCRIDGSTSPAKSAEYEAAFNRGEYDVMLGQIKAMGVAINLQENCELVCFAEETYSHDSNQQAYQRVWRRGQPKLVRVKFYRSLSPLVDMQVNASRKKGALSKKALDG